jgi:hypothetical protein
LSVLHSIFQTIQLEKQLDTMPSNAQAISSLYGKFSAQALNDFKGSLGSRDNTKSLESFLVLCELNKREEALKVYMDHVCIE